MNKTKKSRSGTIPMGIVSLTAIVSGTIGIINQYEILGSGLLIFIGIAMVVSEVYHYFKVKRVDNG